jgi:predicted nuclease of predicted toxin-antitoxin system
MQTIRFHLDESAPTAIAVALRQRGIEVTTPQDLGLLGASDLEQLEFCRVQSRTIFTEDADFLRLHQAGEPHAGIVYCHQQSRTIGEIVRNLALIWELCDPAEMANRLDYI